VGITAKRNITYVMNKAIMYNIKGFAISRLCIKFEIFQTTLTDVSVDGSPHNSSKGLVFLEEIVAPENTCGFVTFVRIRQSLDSRQTCN
jgi:hypothetical protein